SRSISCDALAAAGAIAAIAATAIATSIPLTLSLLPASAARPCARLDRRGLRLTRERPGAPAKTKSCALSVPNQVASRRKVATRPRGVNCRERRCASPRGECMCVRRLAVLVVAAGFGATLAAAVLAGLDRAAATPRSSSHVSILRVDTKLPGWLAPGAAGRVGGFAGANERLRLATASGVQLARTRGGKLGRFGFNFPAPQAGRYRLLVGGSTDTASAGTLTVRPLLLDAVGDITFGEQV